jgi:hypothetical protein
MCGIVFMKWKKDKNNFMKYYGMAFTTMSLER